MHVQPCCARVAHPTLSVNIGAVCILVVSRKSPYISGQGGVYVYLPPLLHFGHIAYPLPTSEQPGLFGLADAVMLIAAVRIGRRIGYRDEIFSSPGIPVFVYCRYSARKLVYRMSKPYQTLVSRLVSGTSDRLGNGFVRYHSYLHGAICGVSAIIVRVSLARLWSWVMCVFLLAHFATPNYITTKLTLFKWSAANSQPYIGIVPFCERFFPLKPQR